MRALPLLAVVALAGCAAAPLPSEHFFRLEIAPPPARPAVTAIVVVERPQAHGIYNDRPLLFLGGDGSYQQYNYQIWITTPPQMLREQLAAYLRAAYGGEHVYSSEAHAPGMLFVKTEVQHLEQITGHGSSARLAMDFIIADHDDAPLAVFSFDETEPAASEAMADYAQAQDRLLARAYARLLDKLDPLARAKR